MLRFLVDACLPTSTAKMIRDLGYDTIDVRKVSLGGAKDPEIFEYGQREGRILVTRDKGFGNLLQYPLGSHKGVILLRLPSTYTASQINRVLKGFMQDVEVERLKKRLAVVEVVRYRLRGS